MKTTIKRPGAGKTKGANSFILLTLAELQNRIGNPTTSIRVSRLDMEKFGANFTQVTQSPKNQTSVPIHEVVQVSTTDFDKEK